MYLLDTDILFELFKNKPSENVVGWCNAVPSKSLYISVISLGILKNKIEKNSYIQQRSLLICWLQTHFIKWFGNNILPIDIKITQRWGDFCFLENDTNILSKLIAATAIEQNFVLVTSSMHYNQDGLKLFNPFI